jgi:hypothetical protein
VEWGGLFESVIYLLWATLRRVESRDKELPREVNLPLSAHRVVNDD